jgi:Leucine-rich repeat (LRR) protein
MSRPQPVHLRGVDAKTTMTAAAPRRGSIDDDSNQPPTQDPIRDNASQISRPRAFDSKTTMGILRRDDDALPMSNRNRVPGVASLSENKQTQDEPASLSSGSLTDTTAPSKASRDTIQPFRNVGAKTTLGIREKAESQHFVDASAEAAQETAAFQVASEGLVPGAFRVLPGAVPALVVPTRQDLSRVIGDPDESTTLPHRHAAPNTFVLPATLVPLAEDENDAPFPKELSIPRATEIDIKESGPVALRRRAIAFILVLAVITLVATVVGVVVGRTSNQLSPSDKQISFKEFVSTTWPVDSPVGTSPQARALRWLEGDVVEPTMMLWRMRQRYSLAVLFYSLNGQWWLNNSGWLTSSHECSWYSDANPCDLADRLVTLSMVRNNVSGTFPLEVGNLTDLESILLSDNKISSSVPAAFGSLSQLYVLDLADNVVSGSIPTELGLLLSVKDLLLSSNELVGGIPTELGLMRNLERIGLGDNELSGTIPSQLGLLSMATDLVLEKNNLLGPIPTEIGLLSNLRALNLNDNRLTGVIPTEIGLLDNLDQCDLSSNPLTGTVPLEM